MHNPVYIASRASIPERSAMWRRFRDERGAPIISTWIDEAGEGETADFGELWERIHEEVARSTRLVLYVEAGDFPLKGALIEVGMALSLRRDVWVMGRGVTIEGRTCRPLGSWIKHPCVGAINLNASDADLAVALRGRPYSSQGEGSAP
jgi:hypothetical protein